MSGPEIHRGKSHSVSMLFPALLTHSLHETSPSQAQLLVPIQPRSFWPHAFLALPFPWFPCTFSVSLLVCLSYRFPLSLSPSVFPLMEGSVLSLPDTSAISTIKSFSSSTLPKSVHVFIFYLIGFLTGLLEWMRYRGSNF